MLFHCISAQSKISLVVCCVSGVSGVLYVCDCKIRVWLSALVFVAVIRKLEKQFVSAT